MAPRTFCLICQVSWITSWLACCAFTNSWCSLSIHHGAEKRQVASADDRTLHETAQFAPEAEYLSDEQVQRELTEAGEDFEAISPPAKQVAMVLQARKLWWV